MSELNGYDLEGRQQSMFAKTICDADIALFAGVSAQVTV